jgi:dihydrofolate reductase
MKASVFIATSLDGFIARPDGDLDWLIGSGQGHGEDYGYNTFIADVDTIVMGRGTYEKVLTFGQWPYLGKRVVVLSSGAIPQPPADADVRQLRGSPSEVVEQLTAAGARHAYVDGGQTVQRFLDAGLIQRLIITRVPVLLGQGIPLFGPTSRDIPLRHVATRAFGTGFVQSEYVT